ncbi:aspartate/glutamate racemase family protein [Pseudorhodoferax sp.]|uniref:aspartate/glutamate racemase family protein n=1 Tax=Pseudorhodoferax sp. TaxID=1993553 RepID=UPI002DD6ABA1|nr:aspartate/glutamate racemase family protein [Pseudorhodoferax sp.]
MRQLLVINPNTSAHVTALLQQHVQREAGAGVQVQSVTARLGAPYIACEASYAVAAHAALDAWAAALAKPGSAAPDAVLIGCFGDPGLFALREASPVPVTGLAEAAFAEAAQQGRFAIVTGGARWVSMLERLALALGHQALAGIHTVAPTGAQLMADPQGARALLARACQEAAERWDAQAVIVGGAGLAGVAAAIQDQVRVPLVDSVGAGARMVLGAALPAPGRSRAGFDVHWQNVAAELKALGEG